jgi:hypothetical protein
MQKCWEEDAQTRPTASQIVEWLGGPSIRAQTMPLTADWNDEFTSKFRRSQQAEPLLPSVTQIERMLFGDGKFVSSVLSLSDFVIQRRSPPKSSKIRQIVSYSLSRGRIIFVCVSYQSIFSG